MPRYQYLRTMGQVRCGIMRVRNRRLRRIRYSLWPRTRVNPNSFRKKKQGHWVDWQKVVKMWYAALAKGPGTRKARNTK